MTAATLRLFPASGPASTADPATPDGPGTVSGPATTAWAVLGTTAELAVADPALLADACDLLCDDLADVDAACSTYRPGSELLAVNAAAATGRPVRVSPLLADVISAALRAARQTSGTVDPTGGARARPAPGPGVTIAARASWRDVRLDADLLTLPPGTWLDPSATTWAWAADRSAAWIADRLGCGVLISLGGDVATGGQAPPGGWRIRVDGATVAIRGGGLATAGASASAWHCGGDVLTAILRPWHGTLMSAPWRLASVTAASCADASAAATAAIIKGYDAPGWLASLGLPARLASVHGTARLVSGWPPAGPPPPKPPAGQPPAGPPAGTQQEGTALA
jgi:thiamine biosynthesis lipoprotein ApbE